MDQQPRGDGAALSGVDRKVAHRHRGGALHIGIVAHDHGGFTAEFEMYLLQGWSGLRHDACAHAFRAGEGDHVHALIGAQQLPLGNAACDDIEHTLWQADLFADLAKQQRRIRRELRRLQHHRTARQQGRGNLGEVEQEGEVVAGDRADHAEWLAHHGGAADGLRTAGHEHIGGDVDRQPLAILAACAGDSGDQMVDRIGDLHPVGDVLRAADFGDDQRGDIRLPRAQGIDHPLHHIGALIHGHARPGAMVKGLTGGDDGRFNLRHARQRCMADHRAGGGIDHRFAACFGSYPGAIDEQVGDIGIGNGHQSGSFARIMSAAFMAMAMAGALVFPETRLGMIEVSHTRRPSTPRTRSCGSSTLAASAPIAAVPAM